MGKQSYENTNIHTTQTHKPEHTHTQTNRKNSLRDKQTDSREMDTQTNRERDTQTNKRNKRETEKGMCHLKVRSRSSGQNSKLLSAI